DEVLVDSDRRPLLAGQLEVRHERRLLDERLYRSERGGNGGELARVYEPRRLAQPSVDEEADHAAEPLHLLARHRVVRMAGKAWIEDAPDAAVSLQPPRQLQGGAVLPLDAQRKRLDPAEQ